MTPEERTRRSDNFRDISSMLVTLTGKDKDHWNAHKYSELLLAAVDELTKELEQINS